MTSDIKNIDTLTFDTAGNGIVLPKTKGYGALKVDPSNPAYNWRDIEGLIYPDPSGADAPVLSEFRTGIRGYAYANNKRLDCNYHIPHDYAPGSDLFIHVHWSHNAGTAVSGNVVFNLAASYSKGHDQANFSAAVTPAITYNLTNIATTPQYRHRVDEIQLSAVSPSATQLDTDDIEVDGLLLVSVTVDLSGATITTASPINTVYIWTLDLHYQSTNVGTKNKAPDFWA